MATFGVDISRYQDPSAMDGTGFMIVNIEDPGAQDKVDRAHRNGQDRHVFAYRLIARDTVEEKIIELQNTKRDLAEAIISADGNLISRLTAEDDQLDQSGIRAESTRLRSVAWTAFYRFKLTSPDQQLTELAALAVEEALGVADASDKMDLKTRSERARARKGRRDAGVRRARPGPGCGGRGQDRMSGRVVVHFDPRRPTIAGSKRPKCTTTTLPPAAWP